MKRSSFLLSLLLLVSSRLLAQNLPMPEVVWGPKLAAETGLVPIEPIAWGENQFLFHFGNPASLKAPEAVLLGFNSELERTDRLLLNLGEKKNDQRRMIELIEWNTQLLLFSVFFDKGTKKRYLQAETLSVNPLQQTDAPRTLAEIDYNAYTTINGGVFRIAQSLDSSRLMVLYDLPYEKGETERLRFHVLLPGFQEEWSREVALPFSAKYFIVEDQTIDKAGNVYILGKYYEKGYQPRAEHDLFILIYRKGMDQPIERRIDLGTKQAEDVSLELAPGGEVICAGFYSETSTAGILGVYHLRLDPANETAETLQFLPLSQDFLRGKSITTAADRGNSGQDEANGGRGRTFVFREVFVTEDGGALLVAEEQSVSKTTQRYGENTQEITEYHYDDVILVRLTPEGTIAWTDVIRKNQETRSTLRLKVSYGVALGREYIYVLYNDNADNLPPNDPRIPKVPKWEEADQPLMVAIYNDKGLMGREVLTTFGDIDVTVSPSLLKQLTDGRVLLYGDGRPSYRLGLMTVR
jgi:hypothetical protein